MLPSNISPFSPDSVKMFYTIFLNVLKYSMLLLMNLKQLNDVKRQRTKATFFFNYKYKLWLNKQKNYLPVNVLKVYFYISRLIKIVINDYFIFLNITKTYLFY